MKTQIKNRYDNSVIFECDAENISQAVAEAVKIKTNLRDANLRGADLRGADLCGSNLYGSNLCGADLCGADLRGADLRGADLRGADLCGADLCGADLRWADLRGAGLREAYLCMANLYGADLRGAGLREAYLYGADLCGKKVKTAKIFSNLYKYIVMAILMPDGSRVVKMGCLKKTIEEWEKIGIRNSNLIEFPDDGSEASEERVIAFEFARATALALR